MGTDKERAHQRSLLVQFLFLYWIVEHVENFHYVSIGFLSYSVLFWLPRFWGVN